MVTSGKERSVKNYLLKFPYESFQIIQGAYAFDSYYCFRTLKEKPITEVLNLVEYELTNLMRLIQTQEYILTLRKAVLNNNFNSWQQTKIQDEIHKILNEINSIKPLKHATVLKGYILIELDANYNEIPPFLYSDLKNIENIIKVPSQLAIPQNELHHFFKKTSSLQEQIEQFYLLQKEIKQTLLDTLEQL